MALVSLAAILFASLRATVAKDGAGQDVLGATAACAAVLVVSVGTKRSVFKGQQEQERENSDLLTLLEVKLPARIRYKYHSAKALIKNMFSSVFSENGFGRSCVCRTNYNR